MLYVPDYYEFSCPVKILAGRKALPNLPYEMDLLSARRALVITDEGVRKAGLLAKVEAAFEGSEAEVAAVFDAVPQDSGDGVVDEIGGIYRAKGCDCIVAVGGGSVIDTAKGVNLIVTEGTDDLLKFQGAERMKGQPQPFVVIPTTAGTGSEATMAAVIANTGGGFKMTFTSYRLFPHVAIIDPEMTMTMPPRVTAATGMDALTHAVEAYYGMQKNPVSDAYAVAAIRMIMDSLLVAVDKPKDVTARLRMANAALLAGIAFSNSLVAVVHTLAHATGGVAHVPHGVANALFLPFGIEYNAAKRAGVIAELAPLFGAPRSGDDARDTQAVADAVRRLGRTLHERTGMPTRLRDAGVSRDQLPRIAAVGVDDGTVAMNPEEVTRDDILALLEKAY